MVEPVLRSHSKDLISKKATISKCHSQVRLGECSCDRQCANFPRIIKRKAQREAREVKSGRENNELRLLFQKPGRRVTKLLKMKYGEKTRLYQDGKLIKCRHHGLHDGWKYSEKHKQIVCLLCMRDRALKYKLSDAYVFKKYLIWARARCKKTDKEYNLTEEFITELYLKQKGKCALSGTVLNEKNLSLDRIDSARGYTKDNVQFVDYSINRMKTDLRESDFIRLCHRISKYCKMRKKGL